MNYLLKHLHILHLFIRQSIIRETQYHAHWIISNLNTLGWSAMRLIYYTITFNQIALVGDWDYPRSLIISGTFMLVHSIYKALFEYNLNHFVKLIYQEDFDHYLLKPISSQFMVSFRIFTPRASIRLVLGSIILYLGLSKMNWTFNPTTLLFYIFLAIIGISIAYSIGFMVMTTSFWLGNSGALSHVPQLMMSMSYMPYDVFPKYMAEILTLVIPLAFFTTIPSRVFFDPQPWQLLYGSIVAIILLILCNRLWHLALRSHTSFG